MEDCFDRILAVYDNGKSSQYKALIKLMNNFKNDSNVFKVKNCLIFLINLCFDVEFSDYMDNLGKSFEDLSESERNQAFELLQAEFNNYNIS